MFLAWSISDLWLTVRCDATNMEECGSSGSGLNATEFTLSRSTLITLVNTYAIKYE